MGSVAGCSALLCITQFLRHSISHSSSVAVTVWLDPWGKKPPAFGIAYLGPSLGKLPHLFFIYWKWLKKYFWSQSYVTCIDWGVCQRQKATREGKWLAACGSRGGCSFLDWCRNSRVHRRKKIYKAEMALSQQLINLEGSWSAGDQAEESSALVTMLINGSWVPFWIRILHFESWK